MKILPQVGIKPFWIQTNNPSWLSYRGSLVRIEAIFLIIIFQICLCIVFDHPIEIFLSSTVKEKTKEVWLRVLVKEPENYFTKWHRKTSCNFSNGCVFLTDSSIADSRQSRVAMPRSRHTVLLSSALLHFADELGVHLCRFSETINMLLKCQLYFLPILSNLVFLMPKYRQNKEMPRSSAFFFAEI